jgi:nitrogen regulatory protein PII
MKKIDAIIQPYKLEGRQQGHTEVYRGQEYVVDFLPKMKLEIVISDGRVDEILNALCAAALSGRIGDGKILVTSVEQAVRIRSGERGDLAL